MKDLNKIILIGRLGTDPVQRETKNGIAVTHFSLATSRRVERAMKEGDPEESKEESKEEIAEGTLKPEKGSRSEETVWHNVVVWGKQAEICGQFLKKGRTVYVEGSIRKRPFIGKDGASRTAYEVHAENVGFLDRFVSNKREAEETLDAAASF
jgi:single-strand DNA-binding protein